MTRLRSFGASPGAQSGDPLSLRIEALRVWWASYAFDSVILTPELIARQTELLADLKRQAERNEDLLSECYRLALEDKARALAGRDAVAGALQAKGLAGQVMPASALLTAEHIASGKVRVFSKPFRRRRHSPNPSPQGGGEVAS